MPDRAFSVKCPKCKKAVRFPGKAATKREEVAETPAAAEPPDEPPPPPAPDPTPAAAAAGDASMPGRPSDASPDDVYAMVALPDVGQAGAITLTLTRLGYHVDTVENWEEGARMLDTASFDVIVTTHAVSAKGGYSPYQKLTRMPLEFRRKMTVLLVGDDVVHRRRQPGVQAPGRHGHQRQRAGDGGNGDPRSHVRAQAASTRRTSTP